MRNKLTVVLAIAFALNVSAFAQEKKPTPGDKQPGDKVPARGISWEEFKGRCEHPETFPDVQVKPANIKLRCTEVRREYIPQAPGSIPLAGTRTVKTELLSDKFVVSPSQRSQPLEAKSGGCLRFKEVDRVYAQEQTFECSQILSLKGDPADYCDMETGKDKGGKPGKDGKQLVEERDTGVAIDTCGTLADGGKGGQ
jgi:hypothetical protein